MKYPQFLKKDGTIAFIATSLGSNTNPYHTRTKLGIKAIEDKGYKIKTGHRLYRNTNLISAKDELRAYDFNRFYKNNKIDFIWSIGGGELMMGMLPYVDFEKIKKLPPKFFMGFSDNTNLTFTLTTICDVASIYGSSPGAFCYENINYDTKDSYSLLTGEKLKFNSYPYYHGPNSHSEEKGILVPQLYNDEVKWLSLRNEKEEFEGRIIGGCLDVLAVLCGTPFDKVKEFNEKYKDDGFIWYFDICDLSSAATRRALWQLDQAGWFKYVRGFLISRPGNDNETMGYSFKQAYEDALKDFNCPILYDVDISHRAPCLPILNGAICKIKYENYQACLEYKLK